MLRVLCAHHGLTKCMYAFMEVHIWTWNEPTGHINHPMTVSPTHKKPYLWSVAKTIPDAMQESTINPILVS